MNHLRLLNDKSVPVELENVATRVGQGDLVRFVRIQPDFALSALEDSRRKALL